MSDTPYNEYNHKDDLLDYDWVDYLSLSTRTENALYNNGITSFARLVSMQDSELRDLSGLGKIGYMEIQEKMTALSNETIEYLVNIPENNYDNSNKSDTILYSTDLNIHVDKAKTSVPIDIAYFSQRTYNALVNNGVKLLGDLTKYTFKDLRNSFDGLGEIGIQEIEAYLYDNAPLETMDLHEYLLLNVKGKRLEIFDRYYGLSNSHAKTTLEAVAKDFGLTRERVRQIKKVVLSKVTKAINLKIINQNVELLISEKINSPVQELPELSNVYQKYGVLKVYIDSRVFDIELYKNDLLNSEWVVNKDFNIDYQLNNAIDALKSQIGPVRIDELTNEFSVNDKILYDIRNTTIKDGLIVLNTNKRATGNDLAFEIKSFMDKTVRPVTVSEVRDALNLNANQARGLMYRIPGVVNVGSSTYALEKYGYTNKTIIDIATDYLKEEGQPTHIDRIISYVKKYRMVKGSSIATQLSVYHDIFSKLDDGYFALSEWGYDPSTSNRSKRLEVPAMMAIIDVLSKSDSPMSPSGVLKAVVNEYGDRSTNKAVTVSSVLVGLYKEGRLTKVGTDKSPFYAIV